MEQTATSSEAAAGSAVLLIQLAIFLLVIIGFWKLFSKAGKPGWAAIIPFYNYFVLIQVAGLQWWWFLLLFIPVINVVASIMILVCLAQKFGRGPGTIIGLIFLPVIFVYILAFGSAEYDAEAKTFIG